MFLTMHLHFYTYAIAISLQMQINEKRRKKVNNQVGKTVFKTNYYHFIKTYTGASRVSFLKD